MRLLFLILALRRYTGEQARISSCLFLLTAYLSPLTAQTYNQIDESGNVTQRSERRNGNFNPHNTDSTNNNKEIPRGIYVWTVDRKFGDIRPAVVDTMPHLYTNATQNTGLYGEYNTTGNNFTARQSRIFADRPLTSQFIFTEPYSYVYRQPDELHFTNTLSPLTNLSYDNCGDKQNGEDHLQAKFAVNAGKRTGIGFDLNYAYASGYFNAQSASHFGATFYGSHLGDRYSMHAIVSLWHQKTTENGGIEDDKYVTHPESFDETYTENEIPTVLDKNWNRNDHQHLFLTHRYNLGFYRKEKMTEEEIKARKFAADSKKEKESKKANAKNSDEEDATVKVAGRPVNAKIATNPSPLNSSLSTDSLSADSTANVAQLIAADTTRVKINSQAQLDSLLSIEKAKEEEDSTMKRVFVPVTSFIHTVEVNNHQRIYQAYNTPSKYYANEYYLGGLNYVADSVFDQTRMLQMKNTVALALLEGFNKYAKAGLKVFATHELRRFEMPDTAGGFSCQQKTMEHNVSIGGKLAKTQGRTLHYNLMGELWAVGEDAGQLKIDFDTDLHFPLLGDTVQLAAKAAFYRLNPTFYQRRYHSRNLWWDLDGELSKETRTRIEGLFSYKRTKTELRIAVEEIQNYTYFGMSYNDVGGMRTNLTAMPLQHSGNLQLLTAQLKQEFRFGLLNWENVLTWQHSSDKETLPLPMLNIFTNLYIKFQIAHVLTVELGANATYFTKYYAPDFCPQINQFAIQQNQDSRIELGEYPFVDVYANMHLKRARFFIMMTNVANGAANRMAFLTPHYPTNYSVLHMGVSWNFFN